MILLFVTTNLFEFIPEILLKNTFIFKFVFNLLVFSIYFLFYVADDFIRREKKADGLYYLLRDENLVSFEFFENCCRRMPVFRLAITRLPTSFLVFVNSHEAQSYSKNKPFQFYMLPIFIY